MLISASLNRALESIFTFKGPFYFIGVVRKTFRLRTVFLLQTLIPPSYFRNIIMTSGITEDERFNSKKLKPVGLADLTASTASDAIPHSSLFGLRSSSYAPTRAVWHLPCRTGNLDNRST